jgi:hypothetical protein
LPHGPGSIILPGRLSLNPLRHVDPCGTVLLPLLLSGLPALFQIDPIGAYFRHTVDPLFNLLVPR